MVVTLTDVAGRHIDEALQEVPQGAVFRRLQERKEEEAVGEACGAEPGACSIWQPPSSPPNPLSPSKTEKKHPLGRLCSTVEHPPASRLRVWAGVGPGASSSFQKRV